MLCDLRSECKPIVSEWIFKRKHNINSSLQTLKSRLVAKHFKQRKDIDYFDTCAPIVRITSIIMLFALASNYDVYICQLDVKTTLLHCI